jgi:tryptophan 2,3-dioxygenase
MLASSDRDRAGLDPRAGSAAAQARRACEDRATMATTSPALTYSSYLALDEILGAQRPRSDEHDEMLFIVMHQVYELWFKQLLHELAHLQRRLEAGQGPRALATVRRVLTILKTVVGQIDVLETMTPSQFAAFRTRLDAASGFQSAQFRELEAVLGRRGAGMLAAYDEDSAARARIAAAMRRRSVFDSYLRYLVSQGLDVPAEALGRDVTGPPEPCEGVQRAILEAYRRDGEAAQVSERFVDVDEGVQEWRYRHVKMVERTIGDKMGTGGSSGAEYLRTTLFRPMFPDLWAVRSAL